MKQTWRWFGPADAVSLRDIVQAGAQGLVTALHHLPAGVVWSGAQIDRRRAEIEAAAGGMLHWEVVESLPVSEDIKRQSGDWREHIENYKKSLRNLAARKIRIICYNFMPVLDWTRTELAHMLPNGAQCMRYDAEDFAAFDMFILKRAGAAADYAPDICEIASARFARMDDSRRTRLAHNVVCGLPGAAAHMDLDDVRQYLQAYDGISESRLRANLVAFLEMVAPEAEALGLSLCCHPDDPPVPLLGLPRIMSTEADFRAIVEAVDSPANGITLCSGSLGARADNDLPAMAARLGAHIHFLHLRNVVRESDVIGGSFHESEHLAGDVDMVAVIAAVLNEEKRRRDAGRTDISIPFRPDHGQNILDDIGRDCQPGYPAIGRLKGLAELRGVIAGLSSGFLSSSVVPSAGPAAQPGRQTA